MQTFKEQEFTDVISKLKKRDVDIARLREQRDQLQAEISERKHLESVKLTSANETKVLAESRSVCPLCTWVSSGADGTLRSELLRYSPRCAG